jgi:hypothetical protein
MMVASEGHMDNGADGHGPWKRTELRRIQGARTDSGVECRLLHFAILSYHYC